MEPSGDNRGRWRRYGQCHFNGQQWERAHRLPGHRWRGGPEVRGEAERHMDVQKIDVDGCDERMSMAMDDQGRAHISYYDPLSKDLKYASSVSVPAAPIDLTVEIGDGRLTLNWTAPSNDGGSSITEYRIFRASAADGDFTLYATVAGLSHHVHGPGPANGVAPALQDKGGQLRGQQSVSPTR